MLSSRLDFVVFKQLDNPARRGRTRRRQIQNQATKVDGVKPISVLVRIDPQDGDPPYSLAEAWVLKHDGGAVAALSNTSNIFVFEAYRLTDGFFEAAYDPTGVGSDLLPPFLYTVAQVNPIFHMNEALKAVASGAGGLNEVSANIGALCLFAFAAIILGARSYRRMLQNELRI